MKPEVKMDYWAIRAAKTQEKLTDKSIAETEKQMRKQFSKSREKIVGQFEETYQHIFSMIKDEKKPTPADLYKLDKYWKMEAELAHQLSALGDKQVAIYDKSFREHYQMIYKMLALTSDEAYSTMDDKAAEQAINQIWCADGKSWSQRVWDNTDKLQEALNEHLVDAIRTGRNPSALKKMLMEDFNVCFRRADTLIRTEMAHIQTAAAEQRYKDYGIQEVEILAEKDAIICPICEKLNKKRYPIGANLPIPAHPNCRCCIVPVVSNSVTLTKNQPQDIIKFDESDRKTQEKVKELQQMGNLKFYKKTQRHQKHAEDLTGKKGEEAWAEYEKMASDFLKIDIDNIHMFGFLAADNSLFKYQEDTNLFAILSNKGTISTLFSPDEGIAYWRKQMNLYKRGKK